MPNRNPYAISFGRIPTQYISRSLIIDDIIDALNSDVVEEQAFKLTGIRGTGKTVTLTTIEKKIREEDDWIVVDLKSNSDITVDLVANLYTNISFISKFVDVNLNLSAFREYILKGKSVVYLDYDNSSEDSILRRFCISEKPKMFKHCCVNKNNAIHVFRSNLLSANP